LVETCSYIDIIYKFVVFDIVCLSPVQTGPGADPASYNVGTVSLSQELSGRSVALPAHPI